ncbi:MAG: flagellar basal-body rod protein FlgG [Phycisphaerae bacterium]
MAITALYSAASGMRAQDTKLDVVANNLANVNTVGFKRSRVNFEDLLYQTRREPGTLNVDDEPVPHGILVGLGALVSGTQLNFQQGSLDPSERPLDLAIDGPGFFQVSTIHEGERIIAYTRAGNFTVNSQGNIVLGNTEGSLLEPTVTLPQDYTGITIARDGEIRVVQPGSPTPSTVGQIEIARFVNPEGLEQIGRNVFIETDASGTPVTGNPQDQGLGAVQTGVLESSNVDPVRELIDLIQTQRAFELNSQTIQSADQALQVVSNLRRF